MATTTDRLEYADASVRLEARPSADDGGVVLLNELHALLTKYVVLPSREAEIAVVLWIAATHAVSAFHHAPRLVITSPEKRCGKSRLLDIIHGTCHAPLMTTNASTAAIVRSIDSAEPPTLLIDEADALWGTRRAAESNEELRSLLNAGHQRGRMALRCVGPNNIPTKFPTFCMAALAGIGQLPDTITDRAVNIAMRRRRSDEFVSAFRNRHDGAALERLRVRIVQWVTSQHPTLEEAEPDMPVDDRAADTWEPLVAIADAAGGEWPVKARHACQVLVRRASEADESRSLNLRLLADVRAAFTEEGATFLPTRRLLGILTAMPEAPWGDEALTAKGLAARLKDYGVAPSHDPQKTLRGYRSRDVDDAGQRYLRPEVSDPSEVVGDAGFREDGSH